jgi:hypothetical protein
MDEKIKIASSPYFLNNYIEILSSILGKIVKVCTPSIDRLGSWVKNAHPYSRATMLLLAATKLSLNFTLKPPQGSVPSLVLLVTLCNSAVILVWPFAITWKEF